MTMTVQSSTSSYLSAAEFLKRVDVRIVGDLCSDSGTRVSQAALATDANLAAALLDASGVLESACMVGLKYQKADLDALVATATAGRALLYRILTALTKLFLVERRVGANVPEDFLAGVEWAQNQLKAIGAGTNILSFTEAGQAGLIDIDAVTPAQVTTRFGPVVQAERYFGTRSDRAVGPSGW